MKIVRFILAGIIMGLPFGPMGILCIGKTLEQGKLIGFSAALGAVAVDLFYAALAFIFLGFFQGKIAEYDTILKIIIGFFLIFIGTKKFFKKPDIKRDMNIIRDVRDVKSCLKNFWELCILSVPNIFNLASLITVFTALDIYRYSGEEALFTLISTMLITEIFLWYFTTSVFHRLRKKITDRSIVLLLKGCALLVIFLGCVLEIRVLMKFLIVAH